MSEPVDVFLTHYCVYRGQRVTKGSHSDPANYRPISLTSVLCKLCEHIIHCAVIQHLTDNNILSDAQHGFRKRRSWESQLICVLDDLTKGLDNKSQIDMVLLDYEKAFDKVSHRHLLKKVQHCGAKGVTLEWISDFLHSRTQSVLADGQKSHCVIWGSTGERSWPPALPDIYQWPTRLHHKLHQSDYSPTIVLCSMCTDRSLPQMMLRVFRRI